MDGRGCRAGTEVDEEQGGGRARQNSRALCSYTRHWETHSNTFTHSHNNTAVHTSACFCPLPHRLALASGRAAPSPLLSWVVGAVRPPPPCHCSPAEPSDRAVPSSSAFLWTKVNSQGHHSPLRASTPDLHKPEDQQHQPVDQGEYREHHPSSEDTRPKV